MQMCKASEVFDLAMIAFDSHTCVPAIERLDESDYATESAAVDESGGVVCVRGYETRVVGGVGTFGGGAHGEMALSE